MMMIVIDVFDKFDDLSIIPIYHIHHIHLSYQQVSIQCSLASRVAVVGVNGAGKSTLVKLMVGELEPDQGTIER